MFLKKRRKWDISPIVFYFTFLDVVVMSTEYNTHFIIKGCFPKKICHYWCFWSKSWIPLEGEGIKEIISKDPKQVKGPNENEAKISEMYSSLPSIILNRPCVLEF